MEGKSERYISRDVTWAIFLIFVGTIFLLNTTGVVGWSIWTYILRFWPVLLILGGLKLIFGKSVLAEVVLSILSVLLLLLVGIFSYSSYTQSSIPFVPQYVSNCIAGRCEGLELSRETIEKEMAVTEAEYPNGLESRLVRLNIGGAQFDLVDSNISDYFTVHALYPTRYTDPRLNSELSDGRLTVNFRSAVVTRPVFFYNDLSEYNLVLGQRDILTDLDIVLGAGEGTLELDDVVLGEVSSKVGAGRLTLNIAERSIPSEGINIEVGAGEVVLELPENVGYVLEYDLGVGNISANGEDIAAFIGSGKNYESENYDSAELKVRITAKVGVGSLSINSR